MRRGEEILVQYVAAAHRCFPSSRQHHNDVPRASNPNIYHSCSLLCASVKKYVYQRYDPGYAAAGDSPEISTGRGLERPTSGHWQRQSRESRGVAPSARSGGGLLTCTHEGGRGSSGWRGQQLAHVQLLEGTGGAPGRCDDCTCHDKS